MSHSIRIAGIVLVLAALAAPALGCPVCFGESDSSMAKGAQLSILFMACLTYFTICGGVAAVVVLRRRQLRRDAEPAGAAARRAETESPS